MKEIHPEHRDASSSSHELPSEPRAKVVLGKHSILSHIHKDRHCDICLRTKITRASCRWQTCTVVPRAEFLCDLITADHKVQIEGCASWHNDRHAVVVHLRYCCNRVWMKNGGGFHGILLPDGKTPLEERFGVPSKGPGCSVWSDGRISPYFCQRPVATASLRQESLAKKTPWRRIVRRNLERRHHGRRHWGTGKDGLIWNPRKKLQRKGSVNAHEWLKIFTFPIADGTVKLAGGSENIHLNPGSPTPRRRARKSSRRIRRIFFKPTSRLIVIGWWS